MSKNESLAEALPREMARVRDEVMPAYQSLGKLMGAQANVAVALTMMRAELDRAAKAMAEQDVAGMMRAHEALKGYST